jgi:hypothetical protein
MDTPMTLPLPFPAARYRFAFAVESPISLPDHAGSMLRGAFGGALRKAVCVTRLSDCKSCPLLRSCAYPAIFETPAPAHHSLQKFSQVPTPYVIVPPAWGARTYAAGEVFHFDMTVIGDTRQQLPLIVHAWQHAFRSGIGRGVARLDTVLVESSDSLHQAIYDPSAECVLPHEATLPLPPPMPMGPITLSVLTPLRLQNNGAPLRPADINAARLLIGLVKRIGLLIEFHAGGAPEIDYRALATAAHGITETKILEWRDWARFSSRQQKAMQLGGVVGQWQLQGNLAPFWPYLYLGQWLHVGKNTPFGLGAYRIAATE